MTTIVRGFHLRGLHWNCINLSSTISLRAHTCGRRKMVLWQRRIAYKDKTSGRYCVMREYSTFECCNATPTPELSLIKADKCWQNTKRLSTLLSTLQYIQWTEKKFCCRMCHSVMCVYVDLTKEVHIIGKDDHQYYIIRQDEWVPLVE